MKRIVSLILIILVLSSGVVYAEGVEATSGIALLADMDGGIILYEKNAGEKFSPYHLTMIVTAMVALEHIEDLDANITAKPDIINASNFSYGNMGILANETLTVKDLIYGMILYDAGEAANVLCDYTFGSDEQFVKMMNEYAKSVGAENTNFVNASGFPNDNQYTTAYDMMKIVKSAMKNKIFAEVCDTVMYQMEPTNKYKQKRYLSNKNALLSTYRDTAYYYPNAVGVKQGGFEGIYHVASTAKRGNTRLLCITANGRVNSGGNSAYTDSINLYKYWFENFKSVKFESKGDIIDEASLINGKNTDRILLVTGEDIYLGLPKEYDEEKLVRTITPDEKIKAPIKKGEKLGTISYKYEDTTISVTDLVAYEEVKRDIIKAGIYYIKKVLTSPFAIIGAVLIIILIAIKKLA